MAEIKNILIGIALLSVVLLSGCSVSEKEQTQDADANSKSILDSQSQNQVADNVKTQTSQDKTLATVNGEEISSQKVSEVRQMYMQQGQQISQDEALEQVISEKVLSQKVEEKGVSVSTKEAEAMIKAQLASQNATIDQYKNQLQTQGMSYEDELEKIKEQLATQEYLEKALENQEFNVSQEEAKKFYEMYKQQSQQELPSFEEMESRIIKSLKQKKQQEAQAALIEELKSNADINYK